ncbi:unnamed protein product [Closterium sp. NIES-53]
MPGMERNRAAPSPREPREAHRHVEFAATSGEYAVTAPMPLKPQRPPCFDPSQRGGPTVQSWVLTMNVFFDANYVESDTAKIRYAVSLLRGPALDWWRVIVTSPRAYEPPSTLAALPRRATRSRAEPRRPAEPRRQTEPRRPAEPRRPTEPRRPAEPRRPTELHCPAYTAPATTAASAATAATAATASMASPTILTFDAEGRTVDFDVWVDDLQLFLQCDSRDGVSLFDHASGVSTAPAATADSTIRSQWTTGDTVARLAVRIHLPSAERAHFDQYKTALSLYEAVVARYSSPATAALSRLMLPYLFP